MLSRIIQTVGVRYCTIVLILTGFILENIRVSVSLPCSSYISDLACDLGAFLLDDDSIS